MKPDATPHQIASWAGQFYSLIRRIEVGDLVIMPPKRKLTIAVGEVSGEYKYRPKVQEFIHGRPVNWINQEVPKDSLDQDLRTVISVVQKTVYQPQSVDAEKRFRAIAKDDSGGTKPPSDGSEEIGPPLDVEEYAIDLIRDYIGKNFHGHGLADLVAFLFEAQGYKVGVSRPGPDGGVDILAGRGPLGFGHPRICVQVKSGKQAVGTGVLRELQGVMQNFGADQALLVSWGGFAKPAEDEARNNYFNVRLWNSYDLMQALLENYDQLSADIRTKLPLKRVWTLIDDEDIG